MGLELFRPWKFVVGQKYGNFIKGIKPLNHHFNLIAVYKKTLGLNLEAVTIKRVI